MNNHQITIPIRYRESMLLCTTTTLMYCYGPAYPDVGKSLSSTDKEKAVKISDFQRDIREQIRERFPDLYASQPYQYPPEALDMPLDLILTREELSILITLFDETLRDGESENFHTLEVVVNAPVTEVRKIYEILLKARDEDATHNCNEK